MIKRIKCTVSEEYILGAGVVIGRVGSHDETALELHFCDIWRGLTKTAFWTDASGQESVPVLLLPNMLLSTEDAEVYEASIPATAKMTQGYAKLIIRGAAVEGEIETIAAVAQAEFEVEAGDVPEDYREELDIEPTAADQIRQGIEEIRESIHDAIQSAADAKEAAQAAETAAGNAERAADKAEGYTNNPPKPVDGMWQLWDGEKYVPSNEPSRGEKGEEGAPGPVGPRGAEGPEGKPGESYVLTEKDKQDIASLVLAEIPTAEEVGF